MTSRYYVKKYADPRRCAAARAHLEWLRDLDSSVRLPAVQHADAHRLILEHLGEHQPGPEHLELLADALGRLHTAAHVRRLHSARLDRPFPTTSGLVISDFITPRRAALQGVQFSAPGTAVALYKDANIRNFLLTADGAAMVDFDDLTLAPFGYDLAKLVVTTTMTHGPLSEDAIWRVLDTYNSRTAETGLSDTHCPAERLRMFAELHHQLTAHYLNRNGYVHPWPQVRPLARSTGVPMNGTTPMPVENGLGRVLGDVVAERRSQHAVWGNQDHLPDGTGPEWAGYVEAARRNCVHAAQTGRLAWRHILAEEVAEALAEDDAESLRAELVQVAAVAVQWIQAIDRRKPKPATEETRRTTP